MEEKTDISEDGLPLTLTCLSSSPLPHKSPAPPISNASHATNATPDQACQSHQSEPSLETIFRGLKLADERNPRMFVAVGAIFQHATRDGEGTDLGVRDRWQEVLERGDDSTRRGLTDIEALKLVRRILDHLWSNGPDEDLVRA